jgi:ATP-dependent DNA helicase RecG
VTLQVTTEDVRALIAAGETFTVEFKGEERGPLSDQDLVAAVVCLANGDGGYVLIGVEDDGRVTGVRPRHEAGITDPARLASLIANRTQPPVRVEVAEVSLDDKPVLVIRVDDASRVVGTTDGRFLRRALGGDGRPSCAPYAAHEMLAHEIDRGATDYAAIEVPEADWGDLDPLEFERFRRLVREGGSGADAALLGLSDLDIAKALGVVTANHDLRAIRAGALLLFGKEDAIKRFVPTHEIAFQALRGTKVETNEFARWPLFRAAEELGARFAARNKEEEVQVGLFRLSIPEFPGVSFREGLANALVHRDYTRLGAIHVQWHDDRLEISSPGGFPSGIRLDNLLVAPPRPRSPILADAFKRAGLVERTGRGINRIFDGQLRIGRRPPDYSRSTAEDVVLVLPGGPPNLAMARFIAEETRGGRPLSLEDLLVVDALLRERRLTTADAARLLQVGEPAARAALNRMVDRGILEGRGETRGRVYHLSAGAYRALGEAVAYVRARGFEPAQQEQMILSHVAAHGRITRREAAELCRITPRQATALLKRLVNRGELVLRGSRRGAYYERTSKI